MKINILFFLKILNSSDRVPPLYQCRILERIQKVFFFFYNYDKRIDTSPEEVDVKILCVIVISIDKKSILKFEK